MQLLEWIAICCAAVTLAASVSQIVPSAARAGAWAEFVVPVAMLGATSGIALGLSGEGPLWIVGGTILLTVGSHDVLTSRSVEALFTSGATTPPVSKHQLVLAAIASAAASALFAIA
jgi:MFS superfamily sulfate permease-like transporter